MKNIMFILMLCTVASVFALTGFADSSVDTALDSTIPPYPVSLTQIDFPATFVSGSSTVPMTITNYWNIIATGTIVSGNPVFTVAPAARLDYTIPPFQARVFNVTFTPTQEGAQTGQLIITSNMPDYTNIFIPMTGTGYSNSAPVATNVTCTGIPVVSMNMTGSYTYTDPDADAEGTTILQWMRISGANTTPITGANALVYHLVEADIGCQVAIQITPVDQHGMAGTAVMSTASPSIEVLPAPQNLTFTVLEAVNVQLNWQPPIHFLNRDFMGYIVYRDAVNIATITNLAVNSYTDSNLAEGDYQYWVVSMFNNPPALSGLSNTVTVHIEPQAPDDNTVTPVSTLQIHPNPSLGVTNVTVSTKANSPVSVKVYNTKGQLVTILTSKTDANGVANLVLESNSNLEAGIYFVTIKSDGKLLSQKFVLIK